MRTTTTLGSKFAGLKTALRIAALLTCGGAQTVRADMSVKVVPPTSNSYLAEDGVDLALPLVMTYHRTIE